MGEFESVLTEIKDLMSGRPGQHLILGGDFNVSFYGLTDCHHVGESIPRPRKLLDRNDSLRENFAHCCGRTGLDGDEHWDGRRLRTIFIQMFQLVGSCRIVGTNGLIMTSR